MSSDIFGDAQVTENGGPVAQSLSYSKKDLKHPSNITEIVASRKWIFLAPSPVKYSFQYVYLCEYRDSSRYFCLGSGSRTVCP